MSPKARLIFALAVVSAYVVLAATHWLGGANIAYELFYRVITFVVIGIAAPSFWLRLSRAPAEPGESVYRQIIIACLIIFTVIVLFPELEAPANWAEIWGWVAHSVAALGLAYFAYRFLPVFLKMVGFTERAVWGALAVLIVVPTVRGAVVAGLAGLLTYAAGSFWPAVPLLSVLFGVLDCGVGVEGLSTTGPWLLAALASLLLLVSFTLRGAAAQNSGKQNETDPLDQVDDQVDEHQR